MKYEYLFKAENKHKISSKNIPQKSYFSKSSCKTPKKSQQKISYYKISQKNINIMKIACHSQISIKFYIE